MSRALRVGPRGACETCGACGARKAGLDEPPIAIGRRDNHIDKMGYWTKN
jgi:hypothetical protein